MRSPIPHLASLALAIFIGCGDNPGVPTASPAGPIVPPAGKALVPPRKDSSPPKKAGKNSVAQPRGDVSPNTFYD